MLFLVAQDFGPEGVVEAEVQSPLMFERAAVAAKAQDAAGVGTGGLIAERDIGFEYVAQGLEWADRWVEEAVEGLVQGRTGREAVACAGRGSRSRADLGRAQSWLSDGLKLSQEKGRYWALTRQLTWALVWLVVSVRLPRRVLRRLVLPS